MKDTFLAILGPKHCDWCIVRGPTIVQRILRNYNHYYSDGNWIQNAYWKWIALNTRLNIWEIGRSWHNKYHVKEAS